MRTYDISLVTKATCNYETHGFEPIEWLVNKENVALTNDRKDIALFERYAPGLVSGHYFFNSRGKEALIASKEFLHEIFTDDYDVRVIFGLTPVEHLGARWLNRKLKFQSQGVLDTIAGPHELVILTKKDWLNE